MINFYRPEKKSKKVVEALLGFLFAFVVNVILIWTATYNLTSGRVPPHDAIVTTLVSVLFIVAADVAGFVILYRFKQSMAIGWGIMTGALTVPVLVVGLCFGVLVLPMGSG